MGTPKSQLPRFERERLEQSDWNEVQAGVEVKTVAHPDWPPKEQYVLCRSRARRQKEAAILQHQQERLGKKLEQIDASLGKRPQRIETVERRIGRWLGRNTMAEKIFSVRVQRDQKGRACGLQISQDKSKAEWSQQAHGAYLLRTNCLEEDPAKLWRWYIQLSQAEDAFRCSKSDLGLRPIYHHTEERVQAHILICFIALVMWRTLESWLQAKGLGNCARQVLHELDNLRSMDVVAPLRDGLPGAIERRAADFGAGEGLPPAPARVG